MRSVGERLSEAEKAASEAAAEKEATRTRLRAALEATSRVKRQFAEFRMSAANMVEEQKKEVGSLSVCLSVYLFVCSRLQARPSQDLHGMLFFFLMA